MHRRRSCAKQNYCFLCCYCKVERIRLVCPRKKSEKNLAGFTTLFFQQILFFPLGPFPIIIVTGSSQQFPSADTFPTYSEAPTDG